MPSNPDDELDDEVWLILDLNEMPGQPDAFESTKDALAALAEFIDLDDDPDRKVELHASDCDDQLGCDCPRYTIAELMPKASA